MNHSDFNNVTDLPEGNGRNEVGAPGYIRASYCDHADNEKFITAMRSLRT